MALDVPASSSDAEQRVEEAAEQRVADRSPMAAQAAGLSARAARRATGTRIVTPTISVRQRLREIWLSRELLIYLVRTEIKVKYKNSVLGLVWSMIAPAMTLAIYFFVFQVVLGNKMPHFVIFLFAGLLLWNLFSLGRPHRHRRRGEQRRHREEGVVPPRDPGPGRRRFGLRLLLLPVRRHGHLHGRACTRRPDLAYFPVLAPGPGRRHRPGLGHRACCCRRSTSTCATPST